MFILEVKHVDVALGHTSVVVNFSEVLKLELKVGL